MKKVFMFSFALCCLLLLAGCGEKKNNSYDETMKEYATNYYNAELKGTEGMVTAKITVAQLRTAKDLGYVDYDMTKLSSCTEDSYVDLNINSSTNAVDSVTYHMECGE